MIIKNTDIDFEKIYSEKTKMFKSEEEKNNDKGILIKTGMRRNGIAIAWDLKNYYLVNKENVVILEVKKGGSIIGECQMRVILYGDRLQVIIYWKRQNIIEIIKLGLRIQIIYRTILIPSLMIME